MSYVPATHLLYVAAARAAKLTIARVDEKGQLSIVAQVPMERMFLGGILPGVTRALVAALARRLGVPLDEAPITRAELLSADEVFLTASTIEVLAVVRVDRMPIGTGRPGPVARALHDRYRAYVGAQLARHRSR